jgi:hypothetical protein
LSWKKPQKAKPVNRGGTKEFFYRVKVRLDSYFVGEAIVEE